MHNDTDTLIKRTEFPVELRGEGYIFHGLVSPLTGDAMPRAIRVDGVIYVATGGVIGGGTIPTRHIFAREVMADFRIVAGV